MQNQGYSKKKPTIMESDLVPPCGKEKIVVSVAVDLMRLLKKPIDGIETTMTGIQMPVKHMEAEQSITEFKMKWDAWPVPEKYVDKAIHDLGLAIKQKMKNSSLMR